MLLNEPEIYTGISIRNIYDALMKDALNKNNYPDGNIYGKDIISINDGIKDIHKGFFPEKEIISAMNDFENLRANKKNRYIYERLVISHFAIETIHPFYDGNGRLGRFLFSLELYNETSSIFAFAISSTIRQNKSKYYKAFKGGRDVHEFGSIDIFVYQMMKILISGAENLLKTLELYKNRMESASDVAKNCKMTKSETKVISLLAESQIFSNYGLSVKEIEKFGKIGRRTIFNTFSKIGRKKYQI
ncbi:MAG: Fic family protein [Erysipelotrichaceae bacterium]|jgi:Fic family protein|nr:Fic family protein [Erysipelotrichaceae bacterium]